VTYNDAYEAVADLYDTTRKRAGKNTPMSATKSRSTWPRKRSAATAIRDETGLRIRDFESGETETYTFAELDAAANRVANYLSEHTDRGARIGAKLPTQFELYAVVFGTIKAGRIYLPLPSSDRTH